MNNAPQIRGGMPKKKDLQRFVNNQDDMQFVAKCSVAMYILLSIAQTYADDINNTCAKYNVCMGSVKHEYKKLDKAMKDYDVAFRQIILAGEEWNFLDGFLKAQDKIVDFIDENAKTFASMYNNIHELIDDFVKKNVDNDRTELDERIKEMSK